jgi:hypothetical protein
MKERFVRMPAGTIGGLKLANRVDVNKNISYEEATDVKRFGTLLQRAFGPPDTDTDADYSYIVRDDDTNVIVRAYSAQSGPAYGGEPDDCFADVASGNFTLRPSVERTLSELDAWLETQ